MRDEGRPGVLEVQTDKRVKAGSGETLWFTSVRRLEADTFLVVVGVVDVWLPMWADRPRPWGAWIVGVDD